MLMLLSFHAGVASLIPLLATSQAHIDNTIREYQCEGKDVAVKDEVEEYEYYSSSEEMIVFRNEVVVIKLLKVWKGQLSNRGLSKSLQDVATQRCHYMECQRPDLQDVFLQNLTILVVWVFMQY
ncbi:hypothetical protein EDD22DRAFT_851359 [Suillus occidentalis]|nr:hypothetical protein EDD22DRAFT_851359 [Suillus occidentalis]